MTTKVFNQSAFDKWDIADESVQAIITSPPYYLCRTYKIPDVVIGGDTNCEHDFGNVTVKTPNATGGQGHKQDTVKGSSFVDYHNRQISSSICSKCNAFRGQYGNEESAARYVKHTLLWLKEAYRVLKENGCLFVVLDDKYSGSNMGRGTRFSNLGKNTEYYDYSELHSHMPKDTTFGVKRKSLLLIPERIMIAMSDAGWIIRNKIWWTRTVPESVKDRFSSQSETIILATKSSRYYFNLDAVREPIKQNTIQRYLKAFNGGKSRADNYKKQGGSLDTAAQRKRAGKFKTLFKALYEEEITKIKDNEGCLFKNPGNIWLDLYLDTHRQAINELGVEGYIKALKSQILTETDLFPPFFEGLHEDHYAPFSQKLVERLILCSTRAGDVVLDPFVGSGTTGRVAIKLQRQFIGIDLGYFDISEKRISNVQINLLA